MPIPKSKSELQAAIASDYRKLRQDLARVPHALAQRVELAGHAKDTEMSVHNLVAYLLGWGELVLKWQRLKSEGATVHFPESGFKWNELGALAQKFYADYAELDFDTLLQRLDATVKDLLALVASQSDAQLYGEAWYDKWTFGRMIQLNTTSPYKNARTRLRKWLRQHELL